MKRIKLTQNKYALVDDKDFEKLSVYKWCFNNGYAMRTQYLGGGKKNQRQIKIYMHREIMNTPLGMDTDHINRNRLDNRQENLRVCTHSQNMANSCNKTGIKGVYFEKRTGNWYAKIKGNIHLGTFISKLEAGRAYNEGAKKYFGEFALLNNLTKI